MKSGRSTEGDLQCCLNVNDSGLLSAVMLFLIASPDFVRKLTVLDQLCQSTLAQFPYRSDAICCMTLENISHVGGLRARVYTCARLQAPQWS